jgi:DAHP synthase ferredoxin-like domain
MIVAMQEGADEPLIQQVIEHLVKLGFEVHRSTGAKMTVLGAVGSGIDFDIRNLELFPGVQEVHRISSPYKLAGKSFRPEGTVVKLANNINVGGNEIIVMAGPCTVESPNPSPRLERRSCGAVLSSREALPTAFRATAKTRSNFFRKPANNSISS